MWEDSTLHQSSGSEVLDMRPEDFFRNSQLLREAVLAEELSSVVVCINQYLSDTLCLSMCFKCVNQFASESLITFVLLKESVLRVFDENHLRIGRSTQ